MTDKKWCCKDKWQHSKLFILRAPNVIFQSVESMEWFSAGYQTSFLGKMDQAGKKGDELQWETYAQYELKPMVA